MYATQRKKKRTQSHPVFFGLSISLLVTLAVFSFSAERDYIEERTYSKKGQLQKTVVRKKEQYQLDSKALFVQGEKKDDTGKYLVLALFSITVISGCSYRWQNY